MSERALTYARDCVQEEVSNVGKCIVHDIKRLLKRAEKELRKGKALGWILGKKKYFIVSLPERQKDIETLKDGNGSG